MTTHPNVSQDGLNTMYSKYSQIFTRAGWFINEIIPDHKKTCITRKLMNITTVCSMYILSAVYIALSDNGGLECLVEC